MERNARAAEEYDLPFPVLMDSDGAVGRSYGAKTTPHMFVIDHGVLVYAGAIDDNSSPSTLGETNHVTAALADGAADRAVKIPQTKSYGCNVKYGTGSP